MKSIHQTFPSNVLHFYHDTTNMRMYVCQFCDFLLFVCIINGFFLCARRLRFRYYVYLRSVFPAILRWRQSHAICCIAIFVFKIDVIASQRKMFFVVFSVQFGTHLVVHSNWLYGISVAKHVNSGLNRNQPYRCFLQPTRQHLMKTVLRNQTMKLTSHSDWPRPPHFQRVIFVSYAIRKNVSVCTFSYTMVFQSFNPFG